MAVHNPRKRLRRRFDARLYKPVEWPTLALHMLLQRFRNLAVAFALPIAISGFLPGSALTANAAPAPTDPSHPVVMQQAASEVATATLPPLKPFTHAAFQAAVGGGGGLQREVFGFALASSLSDPTFGYTTWNFSLLSTVAFFGLHVQGNGAFAADSGAGVWNSSQLTDLINAAHAHATKVVLTIILQDFASGTPNMCAGLAASAATVANTLAEVTTKGVDGVNVDYEGLNGSCGSATDPSLARHEFTAFIASLRSALGPARYLSVDTYAGSAADPVGFFDITGLAPYVDSYFVMAYDLEYANYWRAPTYCPSFCLGPTAPLTGYYYTDTSTADQYRAVVPASKVILGVPYYGRKSCVAAVTQSQFPTSSVIADSYLDASTELSVPGPGFVPGTYAAHRDSNDPAGQERWETWNNTAVNCTRELYWDDTVSLGHKYDLVNADGLRGVGLWNLNYGGGAPELWNTLAAKFTTTTLPWVSLGGVLIEAPSPSSWGASRVDVFAVGTDSALYQRTSDGTSWTPWASLGGRLTSRAAAVSWGPNRIDVFGRGTDNALWHRWYDISGWHNWESLGGVLLTGPGVSSWGNGQLDVFVVGTDGALYSKTFDAGGWHDWQPLGGRLTADPSAVSSHSNRIDVFGRGTDHALYHRWYDTAGWHDWEGLGGNLISGPAVSSCSPAHLDVFAVGTDYGLYRRGANGVWGPWQSLGGQWTSDPGAVCPAGLTSAGLYERGTDLALWQSYLPGS
jgi:spore germination protein YaaH